MIFTFSLDKKVVIISGGYGYLGKAITRSLLFHGAIVYVLAKNTHKFDEAFSDELKESKNLMIVEGDVSSSESLRDTFKFVFEKQGKIDILINNAFFSKGQSPELMTDEEWMIGVDGTLTSVFRAIREIIPYYKKAGKGKIINVSSMYGIVAPDFSVYEDFPVFLNPPHYGASKAGVIQLTKYYASYLGKFGINVNCITPGPFPSDEVQKSKEFIDKLKDKTLLKRIGYPEDLAGTFVFLASDTSNFITGQNIIVDGGWTAK
jgi:NAD(P)-dependent dehydrogenase (short-subunit alcohol dehydrogenase family)